MHSSRVIILVAALLLFATARASAHDPWESNGFDRDATGNVMTIATNRGLMFSSDAGKTWRYLCRVALNKQIPLVGLTSKNQVMVASRQGMDTVGTDGCGLAALSTPMSDNSVNDLHRDPTNRLGWYATTARYQKANGVYYSSDDGATWAPLGALETGPYFKQVRASKDGKRLYVVTAIYYEPVGDEADRTEYQIRSSDDRGATWTTYPITLRKDDRELMLIGVDPTNADRVYGAVHVCRQDESCHDRTMGIRKDSVLVSDDRGMTWKTLFELSEYASFEVDKDNIWLGDWQGGFWRMKRDGTNPEQLSEKYKVGCLMRTENELFVCASDLNGFMLARSTDLGTTVTPVAQSGNTLGNPQCPADPGAVAQIEEVCEVEWHDLCRESFFDDPNPPRECGTSVTGGDAGAPAPSGPDAAVVPSSDAGAVANTKNSDGCALGGASHGGWLLALAALALRRRRAVH